MVRNFVKIYLCALATMSFKAWCRDALHGVCLQTNLWSVDA